QREVDSVALTCTSAAGLARPYGFTYQTHADRVHANAHAGSLFARTHPPFGSCLRRGVRERPISRCPWDQIVTGPQAARCSTAGRRIQFATSTPATRATATRIIRNATSIPASGSLAKNRLML